MQSDEIMCLRAEHKCRIMFGDPSLPEFTPYSDLDNMSHCIFLAGLGLKDKLKRAKIFNRAFK